VNLPPLRVRRPRAALLLLGLAAAVLAYAPAGGAHLPQRAALRLAFLGDVMLGRGVSTAHRAAGSPGWSAAFQTLAPVLARADLAVANLESPITARPPLNSAAFDLRAAPASLLALTAAGVDAVTLANNHAQDSGPAGLRDTVTSAAQAGLLPAAAGQMRFFQAGAYRVGLLALDDVTAPLDLPASTAALAQARPWVDILAVSVHWGVEYTAGPTPREESLARAWQAAGADLIVGHHPHVLQPVVLLPAAGARQAVVAYSLGNALFDQPAPPETRWGAVLLVDWGPAGLEQVSLLPFEINIRAGAVEPAGADIQAWVASRVGSPGVGNPRVASPGTFILTDYR
jgi:poly-gamma-glutamate synthesis protein (capsule biosynthesis protein)